MRDYRLRRAPKRRSETNSNVQSLVAPRGVVAPLSKVWFALAIAKCRHVLTTPITNFLSRTPPETLQRPWSLRPWQQPAGIAVHDGMKLWGIERRLDQLQERCLHREIGGMRTEDDSFDGDAC